MTGGVGISSVILRLPGLKPGEKLLLGLLENLARESGLAYGSIETYAARIGSNPRTVRRRLRSLKRRGIVILERPGGGRSKTAVYRLNLAAAKPGQVASVSSAINPDKSGRKPGQNVRGNPDKSGRKPGQVVPQVYSSCNEVSLQESVRGRSAAPPDPRVKTFIDWFATTYKASIGTAYVFAGGKDGATVKTLLHKLDGDNGAGLAELEAAAEVMLADKWGREHASIGVLSSQINTWRKKSGIAAKDKWANGF